MRRAAKVDGNHRVIVQAFRALGCSVRDTSGAGNGLADLVVGKHGVTHLVEVKMPAEGWRGGFIHLVTSIDDVRSLVSAWDSLASISATRNNAEWKPMPHADSPTLREDVCRCRNEYETCEVCTRPVWPVKPSTLVGPSMPPPGRVIQDFDASDYERPPRVVVHGGLIQRREVRVTPNVIRNKGGL